MNPKNSTVKTSPLRSSAAVFMQPLPAKLGHTAPATIEQFDRERMGIAAKE